MVAFYASGMSMPDFTRHAAGTQLLLVGRERESKWKILVAFGFFMLYLHFFVDEISIFSRWWCSYPPYPSIMWINVNPARMLTSKIIVARDRLGEVHGSPVVNGSPKYQHVLHTTCSGFKGNGNSIIGGWLYLGICRTQMLKMLKFASIEPQDHFLGILVF